MPKGVYQKTEEHKKRIGEANKISKLGTYHSKETKLKISLSHKGKLKSEEHRKNISLANKGKILSEEHKRKIGESCKGKPSGTKGKHWKLSEETKRKMSLFQKGRKHNPMSEETKKKISFAHLGEKSYLWKGGISFEEYPVDWKRSIRIAIRKRDKYTCQICGEKQDDKALSVHHINYNKQNCNPDNLITLCHNCHAKTNHNRDYWINYFLKN